MTSFPFARVICPFGSMASCPLGRMSSLCCASLRHTVLPCTRRQQLATLCYSTAGLCNVATAVQSGATDRLAKRYKAKSAIFVWIDGTPAPHPHWSVRPIGHRRMGNLVGHRHLRSQSKELLRHDALRFFSTMLCAT
jgi:hypothetical protein